MLHPLPKAEASDHPARLLPVLLPIVALGSIVSLVVDLALGADSLVIVDGGLSVGVDAGPSAWLKSGVTVATWLLALTAGAVVAVGARRGRPVGPRVAVTVALRQFPVLALGLCVAVGVAVGVIWTAVRMASAGGDGPFAFVVIAAALLALGVAGTRLLLTVVTRVFGGSAWALTRGRVFRTAGQLPVVGVGLSGGAFVLEQLGEGGWPPVLADLFGAALLVATVYGQAVLLARSYLEPRDAGAVADLEAVDARLAALGAHPAPWPTLGEPTPRDPAQRRWLWLGVAAMLLPIVVSSGVAVTNPVGVPSISTGDPVGAVAALWPSGKHPIIATNTGVRYCEDDLCDSYVERMGMPMASGWSTTTIGPDGTAVTVAATGGQHSGGPFIEYAKCTRAACQHEWLPFRALSKEHIFGYDGTVLYTPPS